MQDVNAVYSTLWRSEAEQHMVFNKHKNQNVLPERPPPPTENVHTTNQDSQKWYQSQEVISTYVQSDLSKKRIPPQMVNETENLYSTLNEEPQKLSPSEKVRPVYDQPAADLSKKKKHSQLMNTSVSTDESPPPIPHKLKYCS